MINEEILAKINSQINTEFYSAYLYLSMSAYFSEKSLQGFAHWCNIQAREEMDHGMILFDFVISRGDKVDFKNIQAPLSNFNSIADVFDIALKHENNISKNIYEIASLCDLKNDKSTKILINWFIKEQIEEEDIFKNILDRINLFGEQPTTLFLLDKEMGDREYKKQIYT